MSAEPVCELHNEGGPCWGKVRSFGRVEPATGAAWDDWLCEGHRLGPGNYLPLWSSARSATRSSPAASCTAAKATDDSPTRVRDPSDSRNQRKLAGMLQAVNVQINVELGPVKMRSVEKLNVQHLADGRVLEPRKQSVVQEELSSGYPKPKSARGHN